MAIEGKVQLLGKDGRADRVLLNPAVADIADDPVLQNFFNDRGHEVVFPPLSPDHAVSCRIGEISPAMWNEKHKVHFGSLCAELADTGIKRMVVLDGSVGNHPETLAQTHTDATIKVDNPIVDAVPRRAMPRRALD